MATNQSFDLSTLQFTDADYQKAAIKWRPQLMMLPLLAVQDILKYMTGWGGIRHKMKMGTVEGDAQFAPYNAFRKQVNNVHADFREIETFPGSVIMDFEPNQHLAQLIGQFAGTLGDSQKEAPSAKLVIACVMKALGYHLRQALFTAARNANGTTTADLFDGWMTIINKEITAGKISVAKGNLLVMDEMFDETNAYDLAKIIDRSSDPQLRAIDKLLYCSPEFADAYNDSYLLTHPSVSYNKEFEQPYVEGSGKRITLCPLDVLSGTKKFILTTKSNMIYGYDNMSQLTKLQVDRFSSFVLTLSALMFFGTQIYTLDKRFFRVIDFTAAAPAPDSDPNPDPEGN